MSDWYREFRPSRPLAVPAGEGIKARSARGPMAAHWWSAKWLAALEAVMDAGRLSRGRQYARSGQVLSLEPAKRGFAAQVQGSRPSPYKVTIELDHLSPRDWETVLNALAADASFVADLLAGQMPADIDLAFAAAEAHLFPTSAEELDLSCSCPDPVTVCKHVAAVIYLIADRLDDDPFLLFHLRGRSGADVLADLRRLRQADEGIESSGHDADREEDWPALTELVDDYWRAGKGLARFETRVLPPALAMPTLKRLGPATFAGVDLETVLAEAYATITRVALDWAAGE